MPKRFLPSFISPGATGRKPRRSSGSPLSKGTSRMSPSAFFNMRISGQSAARTPRAPMPSPRRPSGSCPRTCLSASSRPASFSLSAGKIGALEVFGPAYAKIYWDEPGELRTYIYFWTQQGKNLDGALAAGLRTVELRPRAYYHWSALADLYVKMGNQAEALKAAEKAVEFASPAAKAGHAEKSREDQNRRDAEKIGGGQGSFSRKPRQTNSPERFGDAPRMSSRLSSRVR